MRREQQRRQATAIISKNMLRQNVKEKLSHLSAEEKRLQSAYVISKLIQDEKYAKAVRVGVYLSLPDEIQTDNLLKHIFNAGKSCFIPRYNSRIMQMVRMNSLDEWNTLPRTKWNIAQPAIHDNEREDAVYSDAGLDVIVIPGRAFTKNGCRLGRGKGYYDKYLHAYREKFAGKLPYTIGLAFFEQILPHLPTTDLDVRLDKVLWYDEENAAAAAATTTALS